MWYWYKGKDGTLKMQRTQPKGKECIEEEIHRDGDKSEHILTHIADDGGIYGVDVYTAYHGYGRGPGLKAKISKYFLA